MTSPTTIARGAHGAVAAALLLLAATGCGAGGPAEAAAAPASRRHAVEAPVLARRGSLLFDRSVSATIDARGGSLFLPAGGLLVVVPPGALDRPTTLTATALRGELVAYDFGPRGTRFRVPVAMYQDLGVTAAPAAAALPALAAGAFDDRGELDRRRQRAQVDELIPARVGAHGRTVRFEVSRFTGYVIATGRGDEPRQALGPEP